MMIKRRYLIVLSLSVMIPVVLLCASPTVAQSVYRMSLDSVSGLHSAGTLYTDQAVVFHLRLTVDSDPDTLVIAIWNAFEVYSPTGAGWGTTSGDYTAAITDEMLAKEVQLRSISGSGADTVAFLASQTFVQCGIPGVFDDIGMTLAVGPIDSVYAGHQLCLDSAMFYSGVPQLADWDWALGACHVHVGNTPPDWDGPHCFTIVKRPCAVAVTGDINTTGSITSADIIAMVHVVFFNHIHRSEPCLAASDVNCDESVTAADIIYLVNRVFKGGPAPCNVCALIWTGVWDCE